MRASVCVYERMQARGVACGVVEWRSGRMHACMRVCIRALHVCMPAAGRAGDVTPGTCPFTIVEISLKHGKEMTFLQ